MAGPVARDPAEGRPGSARREALLDVAAGMVAAGDVEAVSMESVAAAAGVSRPLVYKHFPNRHELLRALYQRESGHLHRRLSRAVLEADGVEAKLRALIEGALAAQAERGATFAALAAGGGRPPDVRDVQRRRDATTLDYFTRLAVDEFGLEPSRAATGMRLVLRSIALVLDDYRRDASPSRAATLADVYVSMSMAGLRALSASGQPGTVAPGLVSEEGA